MKKENFKINKHNKGNKMNNTRYLLTLSISDDELNTMRCVLKNQSMRKSITTGFQKIEARIIIEELPQVLMFG